MTDGVDKSLESERSFEELLGRASPRPTPSDADARAAKNAVQAEWAAVTHRRKNRRTFLSLAAAASVLLAVAVFVNVVQSPISVSMPMATIGKSTGAIYVFAESSQGHSIEDMTSVAVGQSIRTERGSSVALELQSGGSLRIGGNTRVRLTSESSVELISGVVYFDSMENALAQSMTIETRHGTVSHVGTQYLVEADDERLQVSCREGDVSIVGLHHDASAVAGEQISITGRARPISLDIAVYGPKWQWIEATAPMPDFDGRTNYEFLQWVARETGLELDISGASTLEVINSDFVTGVMSAEPRVALRQWLATLGLRGDIVGGVIRITDVEVD